MAKLTTGILFLDRHGKKKPYYWMTPNRVYFTSGSGDTTSTGAKFSEYRKFADYYVVAPGEFTAWTS